MERASVELLSLASIDNHQRLLGHLRYVRQTPGDLLSDRRYSLDLATHRFELGSATECIVI